MQSETNKQNANKITTHLRQHFFVRKKTFDGVKSRLFAFCAFLCVWKCVLCFFVRMKVAYLRFVLFCACTSVCKKIKLDITLMPSNHTTTICLMQVHIPQQLLQFQMSSLFRAIRAVKIHSMNIRVWHEKIHSQIYCKGKLYNTAQSFDQFGYKGVCLWTNLI